MSKKQTDHKGVEFSIARDILHSAVQTISKSVAGKTSSLSSFLGNLLIAADDSGLTFRAADRETIVSLQVPGALVTETGQAVVPLRLLTDLVSGFPAGGRVDVSPADSGRTLLKCGRSKSKLTATCEPDIFPLGHEPESEGISLDREAFLEVLDQVAVAASRNDSRPALMGVCFEFSTEGLTLTAVDGFRLATRCLSLATENEEAKVLLPAPSLKRLVRVLGRMDHETVTLYVIEGRAVFQTATFRMEMVTIEERFPNWRSIVPESHAACVTADAEVLWASLRQARLFPVGMGYRRTYPVKVEYINSDVKALRISSTDSEVGNYTAMVPVAGVEGKPASFSFNAAFLLDMLPKLDGTLQMRINSESQPIVFQDGYLTYVVMPMHTK